MVENVGTRAFVTSRAFQSRLHTLTRVHLRQHASAGRSEGVVLWVAFEAGLFRNFTHANRKVLATPSRLIRLRVWIPAALGNEIDLESLFQLLRVGSTMKQWHVRFAVVQ